MKEINPIKIKENMKVSKLVNAMGGMGCVANKVSRAGEILLEMIKDKDCKVFLGQAGPMIPAGLRNIFVDMLRKGFVDVFVTTGATLTHDLIGALGHKHYHGSENASDEELNKKGIDRIYNVYMKNEVYPDLEEFIVNVIQKADKKEMNIKEFIWELGKNVEDENSILRICYEKKIPIFCPAIADCGIGMMLWGEKMKGVDFKIDAIDDLKDILDISWTAKKCGVLYLGGGVPKNFIQQAMQFSNKSNGASYGVQITIDKVEGGGSSGAPLKEGISWGKMSSKGNFVSVYADSIIVLPIIYGYVLDNIN